MTKKDRNKIIEALLWAVSSDCDLVTDILISEFNAHDGDSLVLATVNELAISLHSCTSSTDDWYKTLCLEAAYRLIEGNARLRRKWFGKS